MKRRSWCKNIEDMGLHNCPITKGENTSIEVREEVTEKRMEDRGW